jgi:hypothetical protein
MAVLAWGCYADGGSSSTSYGSAGGGGGAPAGTGEVSNPSNPPMLVVVDTGQTLSAQGGQGVGVFTEYQAGGHWHVWWTCDTSVTGLDCSFDIQLSAMAGTAGDGGAAPGNITNLTSEFASSDAHLTGSAATSDPEITTTTFTGVDGVRFDTAPGATITLTATVNGARNGAFLFFVQDGAVNGGYQGTLSDPLMLVPSSP